MKHAFGRTAAATLGYIAGNVPGAIGAAGLYKAYERR